MEIFVYTAEEKVPFQESYLPLGAFEKIIFSNNFKEGQANFDDDEVESLFKSIDNIDATVFYVPSEIENKFTKLLGNLFNITQWEKEDIAMNPSKDVSGVFGWKELSQFFEKMTLEWIIEPISRGFKKPRKCPQELVKLLNNIVADDPIIDIIFVYDLDKKRVLCNNSQSGGDKKGKLFISNLSSLEKLLGNSKLISNLNEFGKNTQLEELKYEVFKFEKGILVLFFLKELNLPVAFSFVSVKSGAGLGKLLFQIENCFTPEDFDTIKVQLKNFF